MHYVYRMSNLETQTTASECVCNVKRHDHQMMCRENCCGHRVFLHQETARILFFNISSMDLKLPPTKIIVFITRGQILPCNIKCQCHLGLPINIIDSALATGCVREPSQSIYSLMPNTVLVFKSIFP